MIDGDAEQTRRLTDERMSRCSDADADTNGEDIADFDGYADAKAVTTCSDTVSYKHHFANANIPTNTNRYWG